MIRKLPVLNCSALILLVAVGCGEPEAPNVLVILPVGRAGVFAIKQDAIEGGSYRRLGNTIELRIPSSGILLLKDTGFLYKWHNTQVVYANQNPIPYQYDDALDAKNSVACWGLFSTSDTHYYFVGTPSEKRAINSMRVSELQRYLLTDKERRKEKEPVKTNNKRGS